MAYKDAVAATAKPRQFGFITTRVLITEREPLVESENGQTVGQAVDAYINRFYESNDTMHDPALKVPELHSVTVDFPVGE